MHRWGKKWKMYWDQLLKSMIQLCWKVYGARPVAMMAPSEKFTQACSLCTWKKEMGGKNPTPQWVTYSYVWRVISLHVDSAPREMQAWFFSNCVMFDQTSCQDGHTKCASVTGDIVEGGVCIRCIGPRFDATVLLYNEIPVRPWM